MQLGIIGGIGPAATDYYYRKLISKFASENETLDMTIVHADTPTLLNNLEKDNTDAQVEIYTHLTNRLSLAGARCVAITSIAGHFCIEEFTKVSPLPVINMLSCVEDEVVKQGYRKIGILGTMTVMESKFYSGISSAEVVTPRGHLLDDVHCAYVGMAKAGAVNDEQRNIFDNACDHLFNEAKVDAVMLGGTDLALVYSNKISDFELIDCAEIHVDSLFNYFKENK
ncbi:MAG: aspartate/glutamate racemase family protein [Pseudomonadota bacterium]